MLDEVLLIYGHEIHCYIKHDGSLSEKELQLISEASCDIQYNGNIINELKDAAEEMDDFDLLAALQKVEAVIVDWPNMPDQSGYRFSHSRKVNKDEKIELYQGQFSDLIN